MLAKVSALALIGTAAAFNAPMVSKFIFYHIDVLGLPLVQHSSCKIW